ncbi:hypothetical protein Asulf_00356 [Archaeoglobus sulfaticallidus PM70-1]|uniref:Uncharacterized protein n=1 Tax=Archaeoglobus sulfaticallidus PM70-1 TaxID=387631 RepID=N0BJR6_9EURY|nr:hypothetical protein [Archaeoglobus sulfaticallidus]AGK60385.1 hypothetical protein Asulf_00356 [Archaeoglobus sulfaticallidus PM70-1]
MEYINSYLDRLREFLVNKDQKMADQLISEAKIEKMFIDDVKNVYEKYRKNEIAEVDAKKNLDLLKVFVVTQLNNKRKDVMESVGKQPEDIDGEVVKRIVEFIEDAIERIE